jgi:hypothetical protein
MKLDSFAQTDEGSKTNPVRITAVKDYRDPEMNDEDLDEISFAEKTLNITSLEDTLN